MPKFKVKGTFFHGGKTYQGTPEKPAELELPSNKFFITAPRFLNDAYVFASPEFPTEITLPEGEFLDNGLKAEEPEEPKPHHAGKAGGAPSAAQHFGQKVEPKKGGQSGRAADKDAI